MPRKPARKNRLGRPRKSPGSPPTRERIVRAASRLFAERGHDGTTIEDVARETGLTGGAIYRHFAGKPDLLLAVVADALEKTPAFEAVADPSGERIAEAVGFYVTRELDEVRGLGREVHAAARREESVRVLLAAYNERVRKATVARIRAMPAARPAGGPELAADVLLALVLGLAHLDTLAPERAGDARFRAAVQEAAERILGGRRKRLTKK